LKKLVLLLFCLFTLNAQAFRFTQDFQNGFYWASLPVQFIIMDSDSNRLSALTQLASQAVNEWEDSLVDNLWNLSSQNSAPVSNKNIIRWSMNFGQETGMSESTTLAVAVRYTGGPYVARGEIIINGKHPLNGYPDQLRTVLIHELGHTLGLDHSEQPNAVMAPSLQLNYQGLHWDDQQGMAAAVQETRRRQAIGYISPLSRQESSETNAMACGTIDTSANGGGGSNPIFSLGLGLLFALFSLSSKLRQKLMSPISGHG
jgi:hypothetical protein